MRRLQWIAFILGSILILIGLIGQLTHSLWSNTINAALGTFGSAINLIQLILWLSFNESKKPVRVRRADKTSIGASRSSKTSQHFYFRSVSDKFFFRNFQIYSPSIGLICIVISVLICDMFIYQILSFNSNSLLVAFPDGVAAYAPYSRSSSLVAWSPDTRYIAAGGSNGKIDI